MQKAYRPDGWLGLILGTKLYYDFSGKYTFESRMEGLLGAVKVVMKGESLDSEDGVGVRGSFVVVLWCTSVVFMLIFVCHLSEIFFG